MAKPTGTTGFMRVGVNENGVGFGDFHQVPFPERKEEVEIAIAEGFIRSMNRGQRPFFLSNPRVNPENDFDFTVSGPAGDSYLELREVQPGLPYDEAKGGYYSYEFARMLLSAVQAKAAHYVRPESQLFLLLYVTHWAFLPNTTALMCLRYWLAHENPPFDAVFLYVPRDLNEGRAEWIYPFPPKFLGDFDPESVRDHWCLNIDVRTGVITSS